MGASGVEAYSRPGKAVVVESCDRVGPVAGAAAGPAAVADLPAPV